MHEPFIASYIDKEKLLDLPKKKKERTSVGYDRFEAVVGSKFVV